MGSAMTKGDRPSVVYNVKEKLACVTLDFEKDYGDRVNEFNILSSCRSEIDDLGRLFRRLGVPVSGFIRTDLLTDYPECFPVLTNLLQDYHCHSHTHNTKAFQSQEEIAASKATFEEYFGRRPLGYRAPQGVLHKGDIQLLKQHDFKFSSSIFPSYRPGKFNNLSMPTEPFLYENGIMELPFSVVPKLRYTISLSYLKLIGMPLNRACVSLLGLPNVVVFDSHLHDFIVSRESFNKLPRRIRIAYGINKYSGMKYFEGFVQILRHHEYRLVTMTELYEHIAERYV